jgi:hypothetical protein
MNEEERLKKEIDALKRSMNDWVLFLDGNQRDTKAYVRELERRIRELEARQRVY